MPVDETTVLAITCDNPACPGNDLDPVDRTGWLFISSEVYGEPTQQHVFCSTECVNAATTATPEIFATPEDQRRPTPAPALEPTPEPVA